MKSQTRSLLIALGGLVLIELLICWLYRGPTPKSANAPANEFSAERAIALHETLFPDKPHPTGSTENLLVRDRLVEMLRNTGWQVEVQTSVIEGDTKIVLHNVLARHPAIENLDARPLVLASHYDSTRNGPGAGDAGSCVVAVVEAANTLIHSVSKDSVGIKRPLYLLFTDGEEQRLIGAVQFVKRHPLSTLKPLVLNFDARGTRGPALMYQAHPGNRSAIEAWINLLARPRITGSLFMAVNRSMPNITDFLVFEQAGWRGFNFAIIGGAHRYHQPEDTLANLDRRSVQHFGEHALSLARAIATSESDLPETRADLVFFDVLGLFVLHYPIAWCLPLSILAFLLICVANRKALSVRDGVRSLARVGIGSLLVMVTSTAAGWFFSRLLQDLGLLPRRFMWYGPFIHAGFWSVSAIISLGIAGRILRRCSSEGAWASLWWWGSLVGIGVAAIAPEFSHLWLWPAILACVLSFTRWEVNTRTIAVMLGSALLLMPAQHLFSLALGPTAGALICPSFAVTLVPMWSVAGWTEPASPIPQAT